MTRALPLFLALFVAFPALAQTEIPTGPEFPAIPDAVSPPPVAQQTHVATVTSPDASLLLWHETIGHTISQVYLGRVGPDGRVVAATVRPIAPATYMRKHPRAASDGKNILVIWVEEDLTFRRRIFGSLTGPRGEPRPSAPFLIADDIVGDSFGAPDQQNPAAIVWTGEDYVVAWSHREPLLNPREDPPLEKIRYTRVTADGIVLDPDGLFVPDSGRKVIQTRPALAASGDGHAFLAWQDGEEVAGVCAITCPAPPPLPRIAGVLIAPGGVPASSEEIILSEGLNRMRPAVAWNGHHFLIAWKNREDLRIEAARVDLDGQVVQGRGVLIIGDRTYSPDPLAVVADGDRFVIAWSDPSNAAAFSSALLATAVDREGNVTGPWIVSTGPDRLRPALLRTSAGGLLLYYDHTASDPLLVRRIFGMGTTGHSVRRRPAR